MAGAPTIEVKHKDGAGQSRSERLTLLRKSYNRIATLNGRKAETGGSENHRLTLGRLPVQKGSRDRTTTYRHWNSEKNVISILILSHTLSGHGQGKKSLNAKKKGRTAN